MKLRILFGLVLSVALLAMFGCGGGGGGGGGGGALAPVVTAVVKVATTGTGATPVGGALALLNYSASKYSIPPNNPQPDGTNSKVVASGSLGLTAGTIVAGTLLSAGRVNLIMVNATGAAGGEFATITFTLLPGKTPVPAADFVIAPVPAPVVTDTLGATIAGTVAVSSATIQ
ncbi:MAG: hypothetical protein JJE30_07420 [Desulfuromonadales bacterium]|nr:hypothetical protein [Desulfuromonadales bacterium]